MFTFFGLLACAILFLICAWVLLLRTWVGNLIMHVWGSVWGLAVTYKAGYVGFTLLNVASIPVVLYWAGFICGLLTWLSVLNLIISMSKADREARLSDGLSDSSLSNVIGLALFMFIFCFGLSGSWLVILSWLT